MFKMNSHPLYLAHHGIKGMKWGVRRFRNEDGTLTAAGKKRYGKGGDAKKDPGLKAVSGSRQIVGGLRSINSLANSGPRNRYNRRPNLTQEEMDRMSDKDLRDLVNRLNLEQQYSDLTRDTGSRSRISSGLDYTDAVLSIAGGALTVAAALKILRS